MACYRNVNGLNMAALKRVVEAHGAHCFIEGLQRGLCPAKDISCWLTSKPAIKHAKLKEMLDKLITREESAIKSFGEDAASYTKHVEKLLGGC